MSNSTLANAKTLSVALEADGITLSHALGQNFLVNKSIVEKIVKLADVNSNDVILEVGPGAGTLTQTLLGTGSKVVAIEKDKRLKNLLLKNVEVYSENFTLVEGDVLNWKKLLTNNENLPNFCPNKLIANLPYSIAATLVLDLFQQMECLESATVMVQKEVADRMRADVGTKNYGAYTVKLRLFTEYMDSFFVSRNNFLPAPRVDSAVVCLDRRKDLGLTQHVLDNACKSADAAFFNRRKTIYNSCKAYFANVKPANILAWLEECGIDPKIRGEKLKSKEYIKLGIEFDNFFNKCNNK